MNEIAHPVIPVSKSPRTTTGIPGLDDILCGGLTRNHVYLVEGLPGAGKTTLALQFLMDGARRDETGLYITLSETAEELREIAASHGWSLDNITLFELANDAGLDPDSEQSILHPSELELGETIGSIMREVDRLAPVRVRAANSPSGCRVKHLAPQSQSAAASRLSAPSIRGGPAS